MIHLADFDQSAPEPTAIEKWTLPHLESGISKESADDLTDEEKVAMAVACGLPYNLTTNSEGIRIEIIPRFAIVKINQTWKVGVEKSPK